MRRILLLLIAAGALFGLGLGLRRALASDETRIRWLIEGAVDGFNDSRPRRVVDVLSMDWYDRTTGVHRDTLFQILVATAFQEKDPETGRFLWELVVPEESVAIDVSDAPGEGATARLEAALWRKLGEERELRWRIAVEALLREGEDGWEVWSTSYQALEGRGPGRG